MCLYRSHLQDSIGNEDLREGPMDDQMGPSITETREEEGPMMEDDKMYPEPEGDMKNGGQDKEMSREESRDDEDYQMYGGDTIDSADGTVGMATVSCVTVVTLLSAVLWMIV